MAGPGKIAALGLAPRIEELISSGVTTSSAIAEALQKDGHRISQPTVSRYLKEERETRREETRKIVQDHVQKTVPTDLQALEDMEAQCLAWAAEDTAEFSHRLARQHISAHVNGWADKIREAASSITDDKLKIVKEIMTQVVIWITDDLALQKSRIFAMRMASNIIDLKLRYSGVIDGANEGGIYFVNPEKGDRLVQDEKTQRFMVIKGGQE